LRRLRFPAQVRYRSQVVGVRGGRESAWVELSHCLEHGLCFVLVGEWTEPQAVAWTPILHALYLIQLRVLAAGDALVGQSDWRGRGAEIDHEGPWTTEAGRFRQRREQVVNAQVPNFPGQWRICHDFP
jgi:hypothetical protein